MRAITAGAPLGLERGSTVVCVPMPGPDLRGLDYEQVLATVLSLVQHTDPSIPVLLAGPAAQIEPISEGLPSRGRDTATLSLTLKAGTTQSQAVNAAVRASAPSDVVVVTPGIRVTTNWLPRLRAAATSDSIVASATPLSLGSGALELFNTQLGGPQDPKSPLEELARRITEHGLQLRPRVAGAGPGCVYVRRAALELVDPLNETLALDRALADLATRLVAAGTVNVVADDVLVEGSPGPSAVPDAQQSTSAPPTGGGDSGRVQTTIVSDERGRLRRAIDVGRMAVRGLSVTIDGRALTSTVGGTQTYTLELIMALARNRRVAVRVMVAHDLSERAARALAGVSDVELLTYEQAINGPSLTDVVHRPQPVFTPDDLTLLRLVGKRVVIGHQDLISYHNYSYHRDVEHWRSYRRTTRLALAAADQVIFFSEHARDDALAEDLLPDSRTHVVGVGAEVIEPASSAAAAPGGLSADDRFLLCLGADYAHKNRSFALRLLGALRELGWPGRLVLAGAHVPFGSSREREQQLLTGTPELAEHVVDLGPVDEPTKQWLYQHARALLYPTIYEGFGLLPLEAARAGLPCLFAPQASLSEVAGRAATLVPWDASASATEVLTLLSDGPDRDRHLAELRALPIPAWGEVADQLVNVYEHAVKTPPSEVAPRLWQELDREDYIVRLDADISHLKTVAQEHQDAYHALQARVANGLPLIDHGGLLNHAQQRGLMRIAARRHLGPVLLAPLAVLGRRARRDAVPDSADPPGH